MSIKINKSVAASVMVACMMMYVIFQMIGAYALSKNLTLQVVQNDAVRDCDSTRPRALGGKFRSESPKMEGFGFCGIVVTNYGGFSLPEPQLVWRIGVEDRASIDRKLTDGGCFEVLVYGFGEAPKQGNPLTNRGHWEIISVFGKKGCEP